MIDALKFVQGSIAKKDNVPALSHFSIHDGRVTAFNGSMALSSPIEINISCRPRGMPMIRAIASCEDEIVLTLTKAGRLSVKGGKFKAVIDCLDDEGYNVQPEGEVVPVDGVALRAALAVVLPFVGSDAARPWGAGVLLKGGSLYATNNVTVIEHWVGDFGLHGPVNLPGYAVREIVRIKEAPVSFQISPHSVTIHYADGRWLRTQLLPNDWPDLSRILDAPANLRPITPGIFDAVESLKPFLGDNKAVYFLDEAVGTCEDAGRGASYEVQGVAPHGVYTYDFLMLLNGVATSIDWGQYPKAVTFQGAMLRGAIMGRAQPAAPNNG